MEIKIDFMTLADQLGGRIEGVTLPDGTKMLETKWNAGPGRVLMDYFDRMSNQIGPDDKIQFQGHTDPWVMLGILDILRDYQLSTYLAVFDKSVPIEAYATGEMPVAGQPVLFQIDENGDTVVITLKAGEPCLPFEMTMSQMNLPPIPEGKNVYLRLGDGKVLNLLGLALSLGTTCRTMFMEKGDNVYQCAISHVGEVCPGDERVLVV